MRVALDLTSLIPKPTGVDRYCMGLVRALTRLDDGNEYLLFINQEDRGRFTDAADGGQCGLPANFRIVAWSRRLRAARLLFQQVALPPALAALRVDVLHSLAFIMPLLTMRTMRKGRTGHVLTVHDMTSFLAPDCHPRSRRGRAYERAVATSIRRADIVSVPSASVKNDILTILPDVPDDRVRVIPCGVDACFHPRRAEEVDRVLRELGIQRPYILYVGTLDPRKNLPALIKAYARLSAVDGMGADLVLAGQFGWSVDALLSELSVPQLRGRVHVVGYVPEPMLPGLYAGARVFVYPSLLEGFGFPPLEAMASGVPVVASRGSSLEDNLSGAAALVSPQDPDEIARAIRPLLSDESVRNEHIAAGLQRAGTFTWERFARLTLGCYKEIAQASRGEAS